MKQQGFTLIELIMVIVILGILAATAMPKFADLQKDARLATIKGAQASIRAASNLAHATALAQGLGATSSVTMEGTAITMANYYPTADTAGILAAANISSNDYGIVAGTPVSVQGKGASAPGSCKVDYTAATAASAPVVTLTATQANC